MNNPNIASYSVIPRIHGLLIQDIKYLSKLKSTMDVDSEMYDLIDTLCHAKQQIKDTLPKVDGLHNGSASTPQKSHMTGYDLEEAITQSNQTEILNTLIKVETGELNLVQEAIDEAGMPDDLSEIVNKAAADMTKIVDQLQRSKKTQQLGTIVL